MLAPYFLTLFGGDAVPVDDGDHAPVTVAEARAFCRIDGQDEDLLLGALIDAAAAMIEQVTGVVCRARQVTLPYPVFGARVVIYKRPVNAIVDIEYDAADGTVTALDPEGWRLREFAGQPALVPGVGAAFPTTDAIDGAVRVTANVGHVSNDDVDAGIRQAALMMVAHWYSNREAVNVGSTSEVPLSAKALLAPHRRGMLG